MAVHKGKTNKATRMNDEDRWKAEDDLRILMAAESIKNDSKRLKAAMALRKEKIKEMEALGGSKDAA